MDTTFWEISIKHGSLAAQAGSAKDFRTLPECVQVPILVVGKTMVPKWVHKISGAVFLKGPKEEHNFDNLPYGP